MAVAMIGKFGASFQMPRRLVKGTCSELASCLQIVVLCMIELATLRDLNMEYPFKVL
jgi:hypothetical protein